VPNDFACGALFTAFGAQCVPYPQRQWLYVPFMVSMSNHIPFILRFDKLSTNGRNPNANVGCASRTFQTQLPARRSSQKAAKRRTSV
jgi:hypothetical protein